MDKTVKLFTDGSCLGNPGPGGWAVLIRRGASERLVSGSDPKTTNNRMELMAAIAGLEALNEPSSVLIVSDSEYVLHGLRGALDRWRVTGWRTGQRALKNVDLWRRLDAARKPHRITCEWVRGHAGHPENERVDAEAQAKAKAAMTDLLEP